MSFLNLILFSNNSIGENGAKILSLALKEHKSLTSFSLDLSYK